MVDSFSCGYKPLSGNRPVPPAWHGTIPNALTAAGIPCFTGTDSTWMYDTIAFPNFVSEKTSQLTEFLFRFTAFTDSASAALGGWLIDNINFNGNFTIGCGGGINEINSAHLRIFPNPVSSTFHISVLSEPYSEYEAAVYDLTGREVLRQHFNGYEADMERGDVAAGSYFIQVTDLRTKSTFEKHIIFE